MTTINETIQEELQKLKNNETSKIILVAEGCSLSYMKNCVASSPHGDFTAKQIKGTNILEITKREPKKISSISANNLQEEEDISLGIDEDDIKGF